ncbi:hypothetical protein IV203_037483 [Nitzschia inconspicua]|uniref:Uncharacterized protein n=1 Tax=Nitzschia inconspicua TaxID=303405 RepID=A0A9K3LP04_9STRA|nr:hypothetical protein IV203_037483 [Nitzschia inconspicua]
MELPLQDQLPILPPAFIIGSSSPLKRPLPPPKADLLRQHGYRAVPQRNWTRQQPIDKLSPRATQDALARTIKDLHGSITQNDRLKALEIMLQTVSHDNEELHNYELKLEADKVLCLKLGYSFASSPKNQCSVSKEVVMICQCLLQLFKCSQDYLLQSFRNVGATELLPLLIQMATRVMRTKIKRHVEGKSIAEPDGMIHIVRVLRVFAKIVSAKSMLINSMEGELLGLFLRDVVNCLKKSRSKLTASIDDEVLEKLGLIKDLAFRSQANDKVALLVLDGGILLVFLNWCCRKIETIDPVVQEWVTGVMWNLLLESMTREKLLVQFDREDLKQNILKGLLRVLLQHSEKKIVSPLAKKIKRNAISALGNIVADPKCHPTEFFDTDNSLALLSSLVKLVESDDDSIVRRRAMRTIRSMVNPAKFEVQPEKWLQIVPPMFLINVITQSIHEDDDNEFDTQIQACETVVALSKTLTDADWQMIQTALASRMATTIHPRLIGAASRCLAESFKYSCSYKLSPALENVWRRLESLAASDASTHDDISYFYLELAKAEEKNESKSVPSILSCTSVTNALTSILSNTEQRYEMSRERTLNIVLTLLRNDMNKKPLAENEGLLTGLVNLCLLQPSGRNKDSAKKVILDLVPEI